MRRNREKLRKIVTASALCAVVMVGNVRYLDAVPEFPKAEIEMKGGLRRMVENLASHDFAASQERKLRAPTALAATGERPSTTAYPPAAICP